MLELANSPLLLDCLTREYWGHFDAWAIEQLAPLSDNPCYQPKFYKAPASQDELVEAGGYRTCGLHITPGSLIYGFFLPAQVNTLQPTPYIVQVEDVALRLKFFNEPLSNLFAANFKPSALSNNILDTNGRIGSFPNLAVCPHPVTGDGLFKVDFYDALNSTTGPGGNSQRLELIIGVLEVIPTCAQRSPDST